MEQPPRKILFLYFELAGYFLACINRLLELHEVEVHIVRYPVNSVAPFDFKADERVRFYEYKDFNRDSLIALAKKINPDIISNVIHLYL